MKSQLVLVIILSLAAAPLSAGESVTRFVTEEVSESSLASAKGPDWRYYNDEDHRVDFVDWQTSGNPPVQVEAAQSDNGATRQFHPVCDCDCDCQIGSLTDWCDCRQPACMTDQWIRHSCECSQGNCYRAEDGSWLCDDKHCDVSGEVHNPATGALRFGWWGTSNQGSLNKVGEFQDLSASPFWDVDALTSDGRNTWDIILSGLDQEANDARVRYYGPNVAANVMYQRYLRRLDHDPLYGFDLNGPVAPTLADNVVTRDLNVGENYAIRVEQLDARFKGNITDNIKWKLNVWGQRKFGERQSNATAHCFNIGPAAPTAAQNNTCHVLSQAQRIDWVTTEIQPVVEARWEYATVEYSRTMRIFGQEDGLIDRTYTRFGFSPASGVMGPPFEYALTPENFTQIDRLKISTTLAEGNDVYANLYNGDTHNEFRDTHRRFNGFDVRLINTVMDDVTWTAYANLDNEDNQLPTTYLTAPPLSSAPTPAGSPSYDQLSLRHPVNYMRTRTGLKGSWQPFGRPASGGASYGWQDGLAFAGGYEYYILDREFATYDTALGPFTQPDTNTHRIDFGPSVRWSPELNTFVRYKARFVDDPLIGVREANGRFNSNQPEQEHIVDVGGNWTPTGNFMATAQVSMVNRWNESQFANFTEDDYPFMLTAWYAPSDRLSLTGGYSYFSNWIDQDITLGFTVPNVPVPPVRTETTRWSYGGENHLLSLNANYAWTRNVQLVGGYEWNYGTNAFTVPPSPAGADWSLLPSLSDVVVQTQRITAGVDWQPYSGTNVFVRYIYFDYNDISSGLDSGTSHMALAGASADF